MTTSRPGYRLPAGGVIDRKRMLRFTFNGDTFKVIPGIRWLPR